jgi:hypothetical protein
MLEDMEYKRVSTDTSKLTVTQFCTAMTEDKVTRRTIATPQKVKDAVAEYEPQDLTDHQKNSLTHGLNRSQSWLIRWKNLST